MIALLGGGIVLAVRTVGVTLIYRQQNANLASQLCGMYSVDEGNWSDDNSILLNLHDERYNRNLVPDALALSYDIYRVGDKKGRAYHTKSFSDSESKDGWIWLNDYIKGEERYPLVSQEMRSFLRQIKDLTYVDNDDLKYVDKDGIIRASGLVSGVFFQILKNGKIRVAYVTKGTSDLKDWNANVSQFWDGNSEMYKAAYKIAKKISYIKNKSPVVSCLYFFGHSLGGGMANYNAMTTGNPSVTFNAASVHPNSVIENMDNYQYLIKNKSMVGIYVDGEVLSTPFSDILGVPKNGNRYKFEIESKNFANAIERHYLEPMCSQRGLKSFDWNESRTLI